MGLNVRFPQIDYSKCIPQWAPNLEVAMWINASSIIPSNLEPSIIKV